MLFKAGQSQRPAPLKPFVLRIREGHLIGLAMDPGKGAPCAHCVELWLRQRNVWVEPATLTDLKVRRDLLGDLVAENSAHVFYEISHDGLVTRLDCLVFPHPQCECDRSNYIPPREVSKKTNFAFSPIFQLKCARFGTPEGNLWLSSAIGEAPLSGAKVTAYGVAADKEVSRQKAVDEWLKKATVCDDEARSASGEPMKAEILQTGVRQIIPSTARENHPEILGAGANREEAVLQGLYQLARVRTLRKYSATMKNPMLMVGANNWIRQRVPFFLLQQYDLHVLFYPNAMPAWVVGIACFSRVRTDEQPIFVFGSDAVVGKALDMAFAKVLEVCHPVEGEEGQEEKMPQAKKIAHGSKLNLWWTHWIYRCPKISLKDVLHLEPYAQSVDHWREYLRDGEEPVGIVDINNGCLPSGARHLVRISSPSETVRLARNVNGIGTWMNFQDALV